MTSRVHGVTEALWLLASELLFLVTFDGFLWRRAEKKMTGERSQLSQCEPGSHLC